MKKIIILFLLVFPFLSFCQDALTYKGNGCILNSSGQKLTSEQVRSLLIENKEALHLYNVGKTKQMIGNILLYGGIATVTINHLALVQNAKNKGDINPSRNIPYIVGGGLILSAIPIKIGFSKKIKRAITIINDDLRNPKTGFSIESASFVSNSNGVGISFTF
jgi:hypothetical protein